MLSGLATGAPELGNAQQTGGSTSKGAMRSGKGYELLLKMGWQGAGLGKEEDGVKGICMRFIYPAPIQCCHVHCVLS